MGRPNLNRATIAHMANLVVSDPTATLDDMANAVAQCLAQGYSVRAIARELEIDRNLAVSIAKQPEVQAASHIWRERILASQEQLQANTLMLATIRVHQGLTGDVPANDAT